MISVSDKRDLLIEIGTEELPPTALASLGEALEAQVCDRLGRANLTYRASRCFAAPRRLAVLIFDLSVSQPPRHHERRGPALSVAFDADGNPTRAAEGFARSCGVSVNALTKMETPKGVWLAFVQTEPGATAIELIPGIIEASLTGLPIPRRMRWGDRDEEFVRPVHWVVLLFGDEIVPASILGVRAGRETRGHRFHHPGTLFIEKPTAYAPLLATEGKVIADFAERRETIRAQTESIAAGVGGRAQIDLDLLDEVTALVEWPQALLGTFERHFLAVPAEVLITTMQDNQKYFPIMDAGGHLMPYFITIANLESQAPDQIRKGNERVIRPRFSDAEFFWNQDRKIPLSDRQDSLKQVVFQQRLGSLQDKCERTAVLARFIAANCGYDEHWSERAARLAKCDLLTLMVQEFPNLQGTMGRYYALHDGEPEEIAWALEEQYQPRYAGDSLPRTATGRALAVADRLDKMIGIFAIGQAPTGARDPFALRRAALGVLRILIEGEEHSLDLEVLLGQAAQHFNAEIKAETAIEPVFEFMMERLRSYYADQGFQSDAFEAVLACRPTCPRSFDRRIRAVTEFRKLPEASSLAGANKRIKNILRQMPGALPLEVRAELLLESAERKLAGRLAELSSEVMPLIENDLFTEALTRLAALRDPVDHFFDQVMVMTDDKGLRNNRIALLNELESLFLQIADFSYLRP